VLAKGSAPEKGFGPAGAAGVVLVPAKGSLVTGAVFVTPPLGSPAGAVLVKPPLGSPPGGGGAPPPPGGGPKSWANRLEGCDVVSNSIADAMSAGLIALKNSDSVAMVATIFDPLGGELLIVVEIVK
jgi:hypothetical protein